MMMSLSLRMVSNYILFIVCLLDVDAVYEPKKKVRKPPARKDNSMMVNGNNE